MKAAIVSIIIPTYNRESLIGETIASVLAQTFETWECIIVDDGSTDNTIEYVTRQIGDDKRFTITNNTRKKGACGARNTGVEIANGELLVFLDADDLLSKDCLQNRVDFFLQNPSFDFLVFSTLEFRKKINDTNILLNVRSTEDIINRFLNLDVPWLSTGPIWKRESFRKLGYWNEDLLSWQDWELHLRALLGKYSFMHFSLVDNYWRFDEGVESIGKKSVGIDHRRSVLESAIGLKTKAKDNPAYVEKINGLIFWLAERFLESGKKKLAWKAMLLSQEHQPYINKMINTYSVFFKKKFFIKHPYLPTYGTTRKVFYNDSLVLENNLNGQRP